MNTGKPKKGVDSEKISPAKKKKKIKNIEKLSESLFSKESQVRNSKEVTTQMSRIVSPDKDLKKSKKIGKSESRPQSAVQAQIVKDSVQKNLTACQSVAPTEIEEIIAIQSSRMHIDKISKPQLEAQTEHNIQTEMDIIEDNKSCKTIELQQEVKVQEEQKGSSDADRSSIHLLDSSMSSLNNSNSSYQLSLTDLKNMVFDDCPLPILPRGRNYEEGMDLKWRIKRLKQNHTVKLTQKVDEATAVLSPEQAEKQKEAIAKLGEIQNTLEKTGGNIKIANQVQIRLKDYPRLFTYRIYDSFRPSCLLEMRKYMHYLTKREDANANNDDVGQVGEDEISPEQREYLQRNDKTNFPDYVDQSKLLQFDGNFESGNIDSVYVAKSFEYNILLKVDTNTKGNTHWFYFKVLNWAPKTTIGFNILNFSRDMSRFYNKGMTVMTCSESSNGRLRSPWKNDDTTVESYDENEIVRSYRKDDPTIPSRYYSTLNFTYKFPDGGNVNYDYTHNGMMEGTFDDFQGTVICFACGLPFTYSDLQKDLEDCKKFLIKNGGNFIVQVPPKDEIDTDKEDLTKEGTLQNATKTLNSPRNAKGELGTGGSFQGGEKTVQNQNNVQPSMWNGNMGGDAAEDGGRKKPTKQQLAQKDMKIKAAQQVKDQMNKAEMQLMNHGQCLDHISKDKGKMNAGQKIEIVTDYLYFCQEVVSQSMGGLNIFQLTFTKRTSAGAKKFHKKKCLYIQARLHAAETNGSYIMRQLIKELTENHQDYDLVLSNYIIKLVPMLNPDGVTIGNSRSSLVGVDLNRRWSDTNPIMHPEIHFLKLSMITQASSDQGIAIFCDLHGHNRKENCFFYGCNKAADEGMLSWTKTRLLPKILDRIEDSFDYNNCRFKQDKFKLNTARVVVWNELQVTNSFCLETSQYGFYVRDKDYVKQIADNFRDQKKEDDQLIPYNEQNLAQIGSSILQSLTKYVELEVDLEKEYKSTGGWLKPNKLMEVTKKEEAEKPKNQLNRKPSTMQQPPFAAKKLVKKNNSSSKVPQKQNSSIPKPTTSLDKSKNSFPKPVKTKTGLNPKGALIQESEKNTSLQVPNTAQGKLKAKGKDQTISKKELSSYNVTSMVSEKGSPKNQASNWRDFFAAEEIQMGLDDIKKQPDQGNQEDSSGGSDSEPSVDNFEDTEKVWQNDITNFKKQLKQGKKTPSVANEPSRLDRDTQMSHMKRPTASVLKSLHEKEETKATPTPSQLGRVSQTKRVALVHREKPQHTEDPKQIDKRAQKIKQPLQPNKNRNGMHQGPIAQMIQQENPEFRLQNSNFNFGSNQANSNQSAGPASGTDKNMKTPPIRLAQPENFVRQAHQAQLNSNQAPLNMPQGAMSHNQQNITKCFLLNLASPHGQGTQQIHRNQLSPPYVNFQNQVQPTSNRTNAVQNNLPFGSYVNVSNLQNIRERQELAENQPEFFCTGTASFKFKLVPNTQKAVNTQSSINQTNQRFNSQPPVQNPGPVVGMVQGLSPQQMPAPGTEKRERSNAYHKAQRSNTTFVPTAQRIQPSYGAQRNFLANQTNQARNLNNTITGMNTQIAKLNAQKTKSNIQTKFNNEMNPQYSKRTTKQAKSDFNVNQSLNFQNPESALGSLDSESPQKILQTPENHNGRNFINYTASPIQDLENTPQRQGKPKIHLASPMQGKFQNTMNFSLPKGKNFDDDDQIMYPPTKSNKITAKKQPQNYIRYPQTQKKQNQTVNYNGMVTEQIPTQEDGLVVSLDNEPLQSIQYHRTQKHEKTIPQQMNDQFISSSSSPRTYKQQHSIEPQNMFQNQLPIENLAPPIFNSTMPVSQRGQNRTSYNQRQAEMREGKPMSRQTKHGTRSGTRNFDQFDSNNSYNRDQVHSGEVQSQKTASQVWNATANQASDLLPQVFGQINQGLFSNAKKAQAACDLIQQVYASQTQEKMNISGPRINSPRIVGARRFDATQIQTPLKQSRVSSLQGSSRNKHFGSAQSNRLKPDFNRSPGSIPFTSGIAEMRASSQEGMGTFERTMPVESQNNVIYVSHNNSAKNSQYIRIDSNNTMRKSQNSNQR